MAESREASLRELLGDLVRVPGRLDRPVTGLSLDSRLTGPGDLFLARLGQRAHGAEFIEEAIARGACAVAVEIEEGASRQAMRGLVPVFGIPRLGERLGAIAARFYGNPSQRLTVVGITGTNGKTSVSHVLAQVLHRPEIPCGVLGTLGWGLYGALAPATHTTPDPITLQRLMAEMVAQGARWLSMEVSSHGLHQGRVVGVAFDVAVFTNLTRDHLDYHGDMATYGFAKRRLFHQPGLKWAVVNRDDLFGRELMRTMPAAVRVVSYGLEPPAADDTAHGHVVGSRLQLLASGLSLEVTTPWGRGSLSSPLLGRFNASNLLAALTTLGVLGIPLSEALLDLSRAQAVPGRMEAVERSAGAPLVVVDYAHTPDALEQTLTALQDHAGGRLWCVFGCGGNRDRGKRPLMGEVAQRLAHEVVVTNDNPRDEDPANIIADILSGMAAPQEVQVIEDRGAAIAHAIARAAPKDVVLLAGKGHEDYQLLGERRVAFSDREVAARALRLRSAPARCERCG